MHSSAVRRTVVIVILVLLLFPGTSTAGFRESVERTLQLVKSFEGCQEGFGSALNGEAMEYPRIRSDIATALLSRASDGTKEFQWQTKPVSAVADAKNVAFVVRAGVYGQEEPGKRFQLVVNDRDVLTFLTSTREQWTVKGESGIELSFESVMRDQYGDLFGYLRISIPSSLAAADKPVRFKIIGEKQESSAWVMVYEDSTALSYLREQAREQAWCQVDLGAPADGGHLVCTASSSWIGRTLLWQTGRQQSGKSVFAGEGGFARCVLAESQILPDTITLCVGTDTLFHGSIRGDSLNESTIYPKRLVTRRANRQNGLWRLEYQSTYMPEFGRSLLELSDLTGGKGTEYLVMSSHQDIAWMDTPAQCIKDRDEKVITPALSLLRDDPRFCFDLEDVLELREYLSRHPDRKGELATYIQQGRLGIGASFNMPYEDLCSGEMLVRQYYAGLRWFKEHFPGCDSRIVWNVDVPGRSLQSPQVMHKAGVRYLLISRQKPGVYDWDSPDGSSVLVFSPGHYALYNERTTGKPFPDAASYLASFSRQWISHDDRNTLSIPVLSMSDMSAPVRYDDFIDTWNGLRSMSLSDGTTRTIALPSLRYATADSFFSAVEREPRERIHIKGERPNIWLYIHGPTHHRAIDAKREADVYLPAAEIFSTIEGLLYHSFAVYPQSELTAAWEAQLYPDHGWGGKNGEVTDSTFRAKYEYARDVSRKLTFHATRDIAMNIKTPSQKGLPLVLFNSLSWKRSVPVECAVQFPAGSFREGFSLKTSGGKSVPCQVLSVERNADQSLQSARIVFVAEGVPSVGYTTYYLHPEKAPVVPAVVHAAPPRTMESRYYRLTLADGGIRQLFDKALKKNLLDTRKFLGGELFTMQSVGEDAGEWSEPQQPTMEGFDKLSLHKPSWRLVESGPVRQVVEYEQQIDHVTVKQRLVLYKNLKQLDIETALLGWDGTKYREFRLAFPVAMPKGQVSYEVPFGTVEVGKDELAGAPGERYTQDARTIRPRSIQNWIDVSDGTAGMTWGSSVAVWDYRDPTDHPDSDPMLQPLLLASRRSCNAEGNWYLQKGDHHFRFSLTSHGPGWRMGQQFGVGANTPLIVATGPFPGTRKTLPEIESFLSVSARNVVLSTMKRAEEGNQVVARFYECEGKPGKTTVNLPLKALGAERTNIIEEGGRELPAEGKQLKIELGRHAIETYKLTF